MIVMSKIIDPSLRVKYNVKISSRKFIPNTNGKQLSRDGVRGDYAPWNVQKVHNLLTNSGRDFLHLQGYETTGLGANGGNYLAVTSDTTAPSASDTSLTGEITNGGLGRVVGAVAHVAGNTTTTITKTFTSSATHSAVQKSGLFTASTAGTMVHEATFTSVNLETNDQLSVTWTITLS